MLILYRSNFSRDEMHSDGGWSVVKTARTVCDVLGGRRCDELQVHRPQQLVLPHAASVDNVSPNHSEVVAHDSHSRDHAVHCGRNRSQEIGGETDNSTCGKGIGAQLFFCWTRCTDGTSRNQVINPECHRKKYHWLKWNRKSKPGDRQQARNETLWIICHLKTRATHWCTNFTEDGDTPASGEWSTAYDNKVFFLQFWQQAHAPLSLRPVVSGRHAEPGAVLQTDKQF